MKPRPSSVSDHTQEDGDDLSPTYQCAGSTRPLWDAHQITIPVNSNEHSPNLIRREM